MEILICNLKSSFFPDVELACEAEPDNKYNFSSIYMQRELRFKLKFVILTAWYDHHQLLNPFRFSFQNLSVDLMNSCYGMLFVKYSL